jgi:hypothetical protein
MASTCGNNNKNKNKKKVSCVQYVSTITLLEIIHTLGAQNIGDLHTLF